MDSICKIYRQDEQDYQDLHEFYDKTLLTPKFSLIQVMREEIFWYICWIVTFYFAGHSNFIGCRYNKSYIERIRALLVWTGWEEECELLDAEVSFHAG